ncbi:hypothetical protein Calow_1647 [Caldicellulosiruptor owensensis OL]|uniref:Uncharacterized protein n=1 Tax=Caldicellulosiruptor owensensis (strain ATCC 700167 / DSM 13100 / OL) TaxID=632518 RepID=E4Q439_CALOW|nr:hypothetical protein [Caldicellulosiruptor owensensis]ADQ05193.1 hypothetical protein Calow_1647 [Caldicellulosiruptor owensensis OL]
MRWTERDEWDLVNFTDENSRLKAYVPKTSGVWVPPDVRLGKWPNIDNKLLDCIMFPIPEEWQKLLPVKNDPFILASENGENLLADIGWQKKENVEGVLDDFVKLADANDDEILEFVAKWGPLWLCVKHRECIWAPLPSSIKVGYDGCIDYCLWFPAEPLSFYRFYAKQVKAILDAAALLVEGKPVPPSLWKAIGWCEKESEWDISIQRFFLISTVNGWLEATGTTLWLEWGKESYPTLYIDTGWGCFSKIWVELAQCLSNAKQLCVCDLCHQPYIRKDRKPQKGRKNYCPTCRSKNAKQRVYAQKRAVK